MPSIIVPLLHAVNFAEFFSFGDLGEAAGVEVCDAGTYWVSTERLQSHIRRFDFVPKSKNVVGLQIADLVAYPITRHILEPDLINPAFSILEPNIYESDGKRLGLKVIPHK